MNELMNFSEYLTNYLKRHRVSFRKVSEKSGISRTMVTQYANGKNIPQKETVEKIAESLEMSDRECDEFFMAYRISCCGKKEFYARKFLNKIENFTANISSGGYFIKGYIWTRRLSLTIVY